MDAKTEPQGDAPLEPLAPIDPDLEAELHGLYYEDLSVGMSATYARTVTDADVVMFSGISGDTNPIHLAATFANGSMFGGRVAHGMLTASFFSAVIGTKLPGPGCIYMSQTLRWNAPVRAGDTVVTRATITELNDEKQRAKLDMVSLVGHEVVLEGEALVKVPLHNKDG